MIPFLVTVVYLLGIAAAIEAILTARTAQGAIAWSVSLVSFPFLAVPAYAVFGRSKFKGTLEAYEQRKDEIDALIEDPDFGRQMEAMFEADFAHAVPLELVAPSSPCSVARYLGPSVTGCLGLHAFCRNMVVAHFRREFGGKIGRLVAPDLYGPHSGRIGMEAWWAGRDPKATRSPSFPRLTGWPIWR